MIMICNQCGNLFDFKKMDKHEGVYYCIECLDEIMFLENVLKDVM